MSRLHYIWTSVSNSSSSRNEWTSDHHGELEGFNDLGEMIPFQGGTNEVVVHQMYETLNKEGKQDNLKVYWYTAKDQTVPMSATAKKRNCHGTSSFFFPSFFF